MFDWFKDRNRRSATALELYGSSVAQARSTAFYRQLGVADSFSGRFDLVMLHVALLARRLTAEGAGGKDLARLCARSRVRCSRDAMTCGRYRSIAKGAHSRCDALGVG